MLACVVQACALQLLQPSGELAAVAHSFDVIAFSSAATSWAACYEGHLHLLETASRPLSGRQNGRRAYRPNSASTGCMRQLVSWLLPSLSHLSCRCLLALGRRRHCMLTKCGCILLLPWSRA